MPLDTMVSIVANRDRSTWRVSYVCAGSPFCSKEANHLIKDYVVDSENARKIEGILIDLQQGLEPGGQEPGDRSICGRLSVAIDDRSLKRTYQRACDYGEPLTGLLKLLQPTSGN
jgi:hypothetical protein